MDGATRAEQADTLLSVSYLIWAILIMLSYVPVLIYVFSKFAKEICEDYIDVFKILQYVTLLIVFLFSIVFQIWIMVDNENVILYLKLFNFPNAHVFFFQIVNQMCWLNMMIHIKYHRMLNRGVDYEIVRKRIRWVEWISAILNILLYIAIMGMTWFLVVAYAIDRWVTLHSNSLPNQGIQSYNQLLTLCDRGVPNAGFL